MKGHAVIMVVSGDLWDLEILRYLKVVRYVRLKICNELETET